MKRVMVIGCAGSGKSTLSKKLERILDLPVIHLDQYYWKADWVESGEEEWRQKVTEISSRDKWIMDGNYSGTWDIRLPKADTVIFLNRSTFTCLKRITKRIVQYRGRTRPDMPQGCNERFDLEFYHYVATYNLRNRRRVLDLLSNLGDDQQTFVLNNDEQCDQFLKSLKT